MKGDIICGKMTVSRTGIIGTRFNSLFSRLNMFSLVVLARLLKQVPVDFPAAHHLHGDQEIADLSGSGRWAGPARAARCCDDGRWSAGVSVDAQRLLPGAPLDDFFQPDKCAAADEQDLGDVA